MVRYSCEGNALAEIYISLKFLLIQMFIAEFKIQTALNRSLPTLTKYLELFSYFLEMYNGEC